jgi:hypothetical protein
LVQKSSAPRQPVWDVAKRQRLLKPSSTAESKNPPQLYRKTVARIKAQILP